MRGGRRILVGGKETGNFDEFRARMVTEFRAGNAGEEDDRVFGRGGFGGAGELLSERWGEGWRTAGLMTRIRRG